MAPGLDDIITPVYDRVEKILDSLDLMTGEYADIKRMVFGFLFAAGLITVYKPNFAYVNGKPRPLKLLDPTDKDATYFPWYIAGLGGSFLFGVMI